MSHFSETLTSLMGLEKITQIELAQSTGISRSILSRFANGRLSPTRAMLVRLCASISTDSSRRVSLLISHLRDEAAATHNAGITAADYKIEATEPSDQQPFVLPFWLQATFGTLRDQAMRDDPVGRELRGLLDHLAGMILAGQAELADRRQQAPDLELLVAEDPAPYGVTPATAEPIPPSGKVLHPHPVEAAMEKAKSQRRAIAAPKPHKT